MRDATTRELGVRSVGEIREIRIRREVNDAFSWDTSNWSDPNFIEILVDSMVVV
jgi:hypothetical protein